MKILGFVDDDVLIGLDGPLREVPGSRAGELQVRASTAVDELAVERLGAGAGSEGENIHGRRFLIGAGASAHHRRSLC